MRLRCLIKKILGYEEIFSIAYRKLNNESTLLENQQKFYAMKDLKSSWYADPILYKKDGETFIFFEMLNRKTLKGSIAFTKILPDLSLEKPRVIIDENFHLSFPFIFEHHGEIFMIPEAGESESLIIYKCKEFPMKWERHTVIKNKKYYSDSIVVEKNGVYFLICSVMNPKNLLKTKNKIFKLIYKNNKFHIEEICSKNLKNDYSYETRNAGAVIEYMNKKIRPAQLSEPNSYGIALIFNEIEELSAENYRERKIKDVDCLNNYIKIKNANWNLIGTHTYSLNSEYEVIDVKIEVFNPLKWIRRFCRVLRKLR